MLTRDSWAWTIGMLTAVVVGLATLGDTHESYGIPEAMMPFLRLAALILGIVSGKLATSPLRGANDETYDD